jgi:hypothetical protein
MRNHAEEMLFIEVTRKQSRAETGEILVLGDKYSRASVRMPAGRPGLGARWVLVDGKLRLIWSNEEDEEGRRVA